MFCHNFFSVCTKFCRKEYCLLFVYICISVIFSWTNRCVHRISCLLIFCSGRSWKASELRLKSWDDLNKLWYVLMKEKNMLMTQRQMLHAQNLRFSNPERISKVCFLAPCYFYLLFLNPNETLIIWLLAIRTRFLSVQMRNSSVCYLEQVINWYRYLFFYALAFSDWFIYCTCPILDVCELIGCDWSGAYLWLFICNSYILIYIVWGSWWNIPPRHEHLEMGSMDRKCKKTNLNNVFFSPCSLKLLRKIFPCAHT